MTASRTPRPRKICLHETKGTCSRATAATHRWELVVDTGTDASGRRTQSRKRYKSEREAQDALAEISRARRDGVDLTGRSTTFAAVAEEWMESLSVRQVTKNGYSTQLRHPLAAFGDRPIADIRQTDIERLVRSLAASGHSARTSAFVLFVVRSVFSRAVSTRLIVFSPATSVRPEGRPPRDKKSVALSKTDQLRVPAELFRTPLGACWWLAFIGLRRSEVLGMQWGEVDLTPGAEQVTVRRSVSEDTSRGGARSTPEMPKTRRGARTLRIAAFTDMVAALNALRSDRGAADSDWLALDLKGTPLRPDTWSKTWKKACLALGVAPSPVHQLRDYSVMRMREQGYADWYIAYWHGHSEQIMRQVYGAGIDDVGMARTAAAYAATIAESLGKVAA